MIIVSRVITALILGLVGYQIGARTTVTEGLDNYINEAARIAVLVLIGIITGAIVGGLLGKLAARFIEHVRETLRNRSGAELVVGAFGLLVGLAVAALFRFALQGYELVGTYLLLPITLIIAYIFAEIASIKHAEILRLVGVKVERQDAPGKLLDTSVLIDGRIADIVDTGFIDGELVVPVFVLEELQRVADSSDDLRRARGRRGLEVIQRLRKRRVLSTPDEDYPEIDAVDSKLVRYARDHDLSILTTDFNLNRVAQVQQVKVLNVNELANAIKPEFVAGERFELKIIREGKEATQGVGYLDDGTMVIVDRGRERIGETIEVEVASVLQSPTGKLVFSRAVDANGSGTRGASRSGAAEG